LVLDWDQQQLHLLSGTVRHGTVQIHKAAVFREEKSPSPADVEALGRVLRERLKTAGIAAAPVLVCIGRDRVIVKDIRFPAVPANEEPAIVRFQVVKELNDPAEEVVVDYTVTADNGGSGERRALALIVRRDVLAMYREMCRAAGLKLAGLTPRPFGTIACLKHVMGTTVVTPGPESPDATVAVLTAGKPWAEFSVFRGNTLLLSRSLPASAPLALAGEVRRNLAVFTGQAGQQPVAALYLARGVEVETQEQLRNSLSIPVHAFDPFGGVERAELPADNRGAFAGAVGLLHAQAGQRALPINFVAPKEPKPVSDPNKRRLAVAAAVAGVLLLGTVGFCYAKLAARDAELERLFQDKTEKERQLGRFEDDNKRVKALDDWTESEVVWLDELYDLIDRFPDTNSVRLMQFGADPLTHTGKGKPVARMTITGMTTYDSRALDQLQAHLVEDPHYKVGTMNREPNRGRMEAFQFPLKFKTTVDIEKLPPEKYVRRLPDSGKKKIKRRNGNRRDEMMDFGDFGGQP
jgi:Tfp pilus assembly PilM family ATPase